MDVLVDLETLGTGPGAVIASIGAVMFDPMGEGVIEPFYLVVDIQSCLDAGLTVTGDTLYWWLDQGEEARRSLLASPRVRHPLRVILDTFTRWYPTGSKLWAYGATFDPVILASAYRQLGLVEPYTYRDIRCARTLLALANLPKSEPILGHHALNDAIFHARDVQRAYQSLKGAASEAIPNITMIEENTQNAVVTECEGPSGCTAT